MVRYNGGMRKPDRVREYVSVRQSLAQERVRIQERLKELNTALDAVPLPSLSPIDGATTSAKELGLAEEVPGSKRSRGQTRGVAKRGKRIPRSSDG